MKSLLNCKMQLVFGSAIVILIVVGTISYRSMGVSDESYRWVVHTHEVLENFQDLLSEMQTAESSYREFVITGQSRCATGPPRAPQGKPLQRYFCGGWNGDIAEERKHKPDMIILDLGLTAGDGFSVMKRLKANHSPSLIPAIVVSAGDREANMDRALKAGAKAFLQKPVDNAELLAVIRKVLGEPSLPEKPVMHDLGSL